MASCKATVLLGNGKENICKNCIKADVCKIVKEFEKEPVDEMYIEGCDYFKDCTRYVEVVRCKDCKWLNKTKMICMNKNNRVFNTGRTVYSYNFCNYGAKMDKERQK